LENNNYCKHPIKQISLADQQPFIDLVDQILERKKMPPEQGVMTTCPKHPTPCPKHPTLCPDTSELERQIDEMVYKLYGLTEEEVRVVESVGK